MRPRRVDRRSGDDRPRLQPPGDGGNPPRAAKTYGLYPRKGTIVIGSDADIAIWDPAREVTMSQDILHHGPDYTPYEGFRVTGWPVTTLVRGEVVVADGKLVGRKGAGQHLARDASLFAAPVRPVTASTRHPAGAAS
jgi:N-acyl-D-aspartate/D-glutamate deacylase